MALIPDKLCKTVASALGVSFETTREHLRNIRRVEEISFAGYGRGAAKMTTLDASRLLIAIAGSSFAKDSVESLDEFGKLQPIGVGKSIPGSLTKDLKRKIAFDVYVAQMIQDLIDEKDHRSNAYRRTPQNPPPSASFALPLISVVSTRPSDFPRAAIARHFTDRGVSALSFASPKWSAPMLSEVEFGLNVRGVGLMQTRHIPAWALADIARAP